MSETWFNDYILKNIIYISSAPSNKDNLVNNKFPAFFMPLNVGCLDIMGHYYLYWTKPLCNTKFLILGFFKLKLMLMAFN